MKLHIVKHRKAWYGLSAALAAASVIALALWGLRPGIDFTGGSLLEVSAPSAAGVPEVRAAIEAAGHTDASVQEAGTGEYLIRTAALDEPAHQALLAALRAAHGEVEERRFDSIGPVIGDELRRTALLAVATSLLLIGLYIAWAFRGVDEHISSKKAALLTLVKVGHDVLLSVGAFAALGHFLGYEADTAFVASALTILGYSINDGVVVLDRARENLKNRVPGSFEQVIDLSIDQTLARSINTSVTVFLALLAVFLFGGETTRPFALTLLIGVGVGTYSSVFIAAPLLVDWEKRGRK